MSYDWTGMEQITYEEAVDGWINNKHGQIYLIYDDGTEGAAESLKEIKDHYEKYRGEFGVEIKEGQK